MTIAALQDIQAFAVNGSTRSWPIPDSQNNRNDRLWTMTVHEPSCRFAEHDHYRNAPRRVGLDRQHLNVLAEVGLGYSDRKANSKYVWLGCKQCGTQPTQGEAGMRFSRYTNEDWKAIGANSITAQAERVRLNAEEDRKRHAIADARRRFKKAVADAREAWIDQHKAEITGVEMAAAAEWVAANPEQAKLLGTGVTA